jgi:hypothetical protein
MNLLGQLDDRYPSCRLLTAVNARRFLDGQTVCEPGTPEWEVLVDIAGCRHGSALRSRMPKIWRILKLHTLLGPHARDWITDRVAEGRPVDVSTFTPDFGHHSVLVIGVDPNLGPLVVNWEKERRISRVPWDEIGIPPYARNDAVAFSLGN